MDDERDDAALVVAARGGDKGAFGALVARHRPLLLALCRRALGEAAAAEDAAQEAVLQAMLGLDRLRRPERFGPWLAGIGLNVCRRTLQARPRDAWSWEAVVGGRRGAEPSDDGADQAALAEAADLAARVRRAVAVLPPGQRAAVALFYLAGLTHAETAAQLGIGVGAVKGRLHKARARLRRELWTTWKEDAMPATIEANAVEMRVADVRRRPPGEGDAADHLVVVLDEVGGARRLPIWVGEFEGTALAVHLAGVDVPRPLTHAFAASILAAAGGRVREARIARLVGDVFYATVVVEGPNGAVAVDARPSDALNLAVLVGAPVLADPAVLDAARSDDPQRAPETLFAEGTEGAAAIAARMVEGWAKQRAAATAPTAAEDAP